jgi:hypothetical protein
MDSSREKLPNVQSVTTQKEVRRVARQQSPRLFSRVSGNGSRTNESNTRLSGIFSRCRPASTPRWSFDKTVPHSRGSPEGQGTPELEFVEKELFGPLGLDHFTWYADNAGIHSAGLSGLWRARDILNLVNSTGARAMAEPPNHFAGVYYRVRESAKFGRLLWEPARLDLVIVCTSDWTARVPGALHSRRPVRRTRDCDAIFPRQQSCTPARRES